MDKEFMTAFLSEMLDWEDWFDNIRKSESYKNDVSNQSSSKAEAKEKAKAIIDKYLSIKAISKNGEAFLAVLPTARPRYFSQEIVTIEEDGKKIKVITRNTKSPKARIMYVLLKGESGLKINEIYSSYADQEWDKKSSL
ncbi:hypothetical protein HA050_20855 [Iodobacter sp. HSC-16F04]|uniref:NTF2 fold immunity protein domain-containing protein n=1 Tax=Iodobacter violaceini TaxID=3044271 RepID=A0ABX0L1D7_9NEIS|nr:NTF2 fold immunity protein [Iodobacter violacea]NHQ88552.1 hypothetical protein [Iodobacter violacea]